MKALTRRLMNWRVYVIIDAQTLGRRNPVAIARAAIRGGADVVQWRGKHLEACALWQWAVKLQAVCRAAGVPFIVNDRPDIAAAVGADGVHLGQDDLPIRVARGILPKGSIIGCSTHSMAQALRAERDGADYIGIGPVFSTPTKPTYRPVTLSLVRRVTSNVHLPHVAIGGIDQHNVGEVVAAGARCVAVVRAITAAERPFQATRALREKISAVV